MADLQELFARLESQSATSSGASGANQTYHQSSSSPIFSPVPSGPQPHHQSAAMSPNTSITNTPAPEQSSSDRTASLLNLLKFNQPGAAAPHQAIAPEHRPSHASVQNLQAPDNSTHERTISASDLVASFMRKPSSQGSTHTPAAVPSAPSGKAEQAPSSSENPQDLLLRLLNHPKPAQSDSLSAKQSGEVLASIETSNMSETAVDDLAQDLADARSEKTSSNPSVRNRTESPIRVFGGDNAGQASPFEPASSTPKAPIFTYVNPFEQLSALSPRNRTPVSDRSKPTVSKMEILKPKHGRDTSSIITGDSKDQSAERSSPAPKARKLSPSSVQTPITSPPVTPVPDYPPATVSEAVSGIGEKVDKQVEEALAQVDKKANGHSMAKAEDVPMAKGAVKEMERAIHDTAVEIKKELEDDKNVRALDETLPKPIAEALKEVVEDVAQADVADSWESAEADDSPVKEEEQTVRVYKFPMKAFAAIAANNLPDRALAIRQETMMDIARLKKEFDQIDRSLVAATKNFIVYALAKHGGLRIIRQENGHFRQVFHGFKERIFNLAMCTAADVQPSEDLPESILGIGVNGTVFWASALGSREDQIDSLETQGLIFPPAPAQDDNTSGGQLKTRAKTSSRHPDYFAVGRGKSINIVWPKVARDPRYTDQKSRVCNSEKYLQERSLKILTGKAGKDFAFSEDDTVIVSLDKAGKMRFWDVRELTTGEFGIPTGEFPPIEIKEPLLEFTTTSPNAKSWPTSVFFFDKDRPCAKGIALRYVMVGMKQNHTFQLWDLGLGKAVQEISLPHEKESDAICSVAFHPRTGILAVGHPTRNSIYFIHVSCPRYNLQATSQATYITRLARKDAKTPLPTVNATAIMTSILEYSFASKGQLRSLQMLNDPVSPSENDTPDNNPLFELYVMHSKGVSCMGVRRFDLGWKKDGEALHPVDAEAEGIIVVGPIRSIQAQVVEDTTAAGEITAPPPGPSRSPRESVKKENSASSRQSLDPEATTRASTLAKVESKQDAARAAIINGSEKVEKKKKKRSNADTASQTSSATRTNPSIVTATSYAQAAQRAKSPSPKPTPAAEPAASAKAPETEAPEWATRLLSQHLQQSPPAAPSTSHMEQDIKKLEENISAEFSKGFTRELESLYRRFDEDKRVQAAANAAKQDAVLRLVSSTLSENVEKSLTRIISSSIQDVVVPNLQSTVTASLDRRLTESISTSIQAAVPKEINSILPNAVTKTMQDPEVLGTISELVSKRVTNQVESTVSACLGSIVTPAFSDFAATIEHRVSEQLHQAGAQRHNDAAKIEQLTNLVRGLSETVQSMAASQSEFQAQILKHQQNNPHPHTRDGSQEASSAQPGPSPVKSPEEEEQETITRLMSEGNFHAGTVTVSKFRVQCLGCVR